MARTQSVKTIEPQAAPVAVAQDTSEIDALKKRIATLEKEAEWVRSAIGWMLPPRLRPAGSNIVELGK